MVPPTVVTLCNVQCILGMKINLKYIFFPKLNSRKLSAFTPLHHQLLANPSGCSWGEKDLSAILISILFKLSSLCA